MTEDKQIKVKICGNCKWFVPSEFFKKSGDCHKHAPVGVNEDLWCGDYEQS